MNDQQLKMASEFWTKHFGIPVSPEDVRRIAEDDDLFYSALAELVNSPEFDKMPETMNDMPDWLR